MIAVYNNDVLGVLGMALLSANVAEREGHTSLTGQALLGVFANGAGFRDMAQRYFVRTRAADVGSEARRDLVFVDVCESTILLAHGALERVNRLCREGSARAREIGDWQSLGLFELNRAFSEMYVGRLRNMVAHASQVVEYLGRDDSSENATIAVRTLGLAYCLAGRLEDAHGLVETHSLRMGAGAGGLALATFEATRAQIFAGLGRLDEAVRCADRAVDLWTNSAVVTALNPQYFSGPLDVYLAQFERSRGLPAEEARWQRRCALVLKYQQQWAKSHPVGTAQHLLYTARFQRVSGEHEQALESLRAGIFEADGMGLGYHGALARYYQARWEHPVGPGRVSAMREARRLLEDVGAQGVARGLGESSDDPRGPELSEDAGSWG